MTVNVPDEAEGRDWDPPFCSNDCPELACPACGEDGCIQVREQETYFEGGVEAYCSECHALLEVQAAVEITFSDAEVM